MTSDSIPQTPTLDEMITAPANEWRELCALAGADADYIKDLRNRKDNPTPKRKSNTRRAGASRASRPYQPPTTAAQAFSRQCAATREALDRVNNPTPDWKICEVCETVYDEGTFCPDCRVPHEDRILWITPAGETWLTRDLPPTPRNLRPEEAVT